MSHLESIPMSPSVKKAMPRVAATERDPRWAAVLSRDSKADGKFYYSVATTGVYCRPSCASRRAKPENVAFHATREAAERAGFRACKRCKPDQPALAEQQAATVARICRLIEHAETTPSLASLADEAGMSVFHFHRVFKAVTGLTPKAYAAAHRSGRVRKELARSRTVTEAIFDAGFNSNSRFYETSDQVLGMTPTAFRTGGKDAQIRFAIGECSLGSVLVAASDKGVCAILLGDDPEALVRELQDRFARAQLIGGDRKFEKLVAQVVGLHRGAGRRARSATGRARHGIPAAGMAGIAQDPRGLHGELLRYRQAHSRAQGSAGRGPGLRIKRHRSRDPLPPRRPQRRRAVRISMGHRAQARAAGSRGAQ